MYHQFCKYSFGIGLGILMACASSENNLYDHVMPEESRFTKVALVERLDEPMELEVLSDGRVLFIERKGKVKLFDPITKDTETVGFLEVYPEHEDGLLGMAVDPDFDHNGWVYFYYAPAGDESINRLSRFDFNENRLDLSSEKIMLEIPVFRGCCHSGGSLEFGPGGNLFLSLGDDTSPFESDNYNPIDERPGRAEAFDAQRSSGNSKDLRGGILRIRPEPDGSYSIPEGNLFAEGTPNTSPEIYVLGNRNPFRISVDQRNGFLYWGEVGPDAHQDSVGRGPRGYDEVNQAKEAGFFGWPYFVGDNKAYWYYDFENQKSHFQYDDSKPINNSPNNTGVNKLPPAQKAFIWYPYAASEEFPLLGEGGRNAMAGPVYYYGDFENSDSKFPKYFDGKLFIYDWMRNWIMLVTMDENHNYVSMEPFMPSTQFDKPIDMHFAKDGSLYILEYGTFWNSQNDDAGLYRITFSEGNRRPVVNINADKKQGAAPLTVKFSSEGTFDYDTEDELVFEWRFDQENVQSTVPHPVFSFEEPGMYRPSLTVRDKKGMETRMEMEIVVGNEPPHVGFEIAGNRSFYWDNSRRLDYEVKVNDKEDGTLESGSIAPSEVIVSYIYLKEGFDMIEAAQGHQAGSAVIGLKGKTLMDGSDCAACHAYDRASVGPTYKEIAERYDGQQINEILVSKIVEGGGGNWGERHMPAHPQLSEADAAEMVKYILASGEGNKSMETPEMDIKGYLSLDSHANSQGHYILTASYQDKGANGLAPSVGREQLVLRHARLLAASADGFHDAAKANNRGSYLVKFTANGAYLHFRNIDLHGINHLVFEVDPGNTSGKLEVRLGTPMGELLASTPVVSKGDRPVESQGRWFETRINLSPRIAQEDLFIVFNGDPKTNIWNSFLLNTVYFGKSE